ncbi:TPA: cell division regulator GpsB [Streptococcus agalactiae]
MASIIYSPKDIFEQDFKVSMRGYDKKEVDVFLDDVIKDYENYLEQIEKLQMENRRLQQALDKKESEASNVRNSGTAMHNQKPIAQSATNFDILKRISRLEKEVFGRQIRE